MEHWVRDDAAPPIRLPYHGAAPIATAAGPGSRWNIRTDFRHLHEQIATAEGPASRWNMRMRRTRFERPAGWTGKTTSKAVCVPPAKSWWADLEV